MKKLGRTSINKRFIILLIIAIIGLNFFLYSFYNSYITSLEKEKNLHSKFLIETINSIFTYYSEEAEKGTISLKQAQNLCKESIRAAKYDEYGYFWIVSTNGTLVMHPELQNEENTNILNKKDKNEKYYIKEIIETAQNGGGWVSYFRAKPDNSEEDEKKKVSYVALFERWNWVVGTGIYLDKIKKDVVKNTLQASGILLFLLIAGAAFTITEARHLIKRLNHIAIRDPLTGLYTKEFFDETVSMLLKRQKRNPEMCLAVMFFDLDHFKNVNDTYGHAAGDKVLQESAQTLLDSTRNDDFCIRYGGEEFLVAGLFQNKQQSFEYCQRIRKSIENQSFFIRKKEIHITISAGLAFHQPDRNFKQTIKEADQLLYQAKKNGRNRVEKK